MEQKWRAIEGFEKYHISNDGIIISLWCKSGPRETPLTIKQNFGSWGYTTVELRGVQKKTNNRYKKYVHKLVAKEFVRNPLNKKYVTHVDNDKKNNNSRNLEWLTYEEVVEKMIKRGLAINDTGKTRVFGLL